MQQPTQYAPQQVVNVQNVPADGPRVRANSEAKVVKALSGIQLAIGILCILLNSIAIGVFDPGRHTFNPVGTGIWCGVLFIITGALGFGAAKSKTNWLIISFMTMCIISAALTVAIFTVSGIEVAISEGYINRYYRYISRGPPNMVINTTMLILALMELVIAIVASAVCCSTVCGCCVTPTAVAVHHPNQTNAVAYVEGSAPGVSYYTKPLTSAIQARKLHSDVEPSSRSASSIKTAYHGGPGTSTNNSRSEYTELALW